MRYINNIKNTLKVQSPLLYYVLVLHLFCMIPCIIGIGIDDRTLMGINVWIKPLKFAISGAIFIASVGYFITLYPFSARKKSIINNLTALTLLFEFFIIFAQAARGVKSHYNMSSALDALLYAGMGILVSINVLTMVFFIVATIRRKLDTSKSIQWSILLGWIIAFLGSWVGGQMISQLSHNVGIADGGAGLPLLNWSTIAGDLRVAHFFGLHGLQIIPLFAFMLAKKWTTSDKKQIIAVTIFGLCYASWIAYTFYQAKQGMPFIKL